jgi:hypothetical protein
MKYLTLTPDTVHTAQILLNYTSIHEQAQSWGIAYVWEFLRTGIGVEEARESGLTTYVSEYRRHLTHCWENDECHAIRELVDATGVYSIDQYWHLCQQTLADLGITPEVLGW